MYDACSVAVEREALDLSALLISSADLGERAGSGLPKIRSGWEQEGHSLQLYDSFDPFDHTMLEMKWASTSARIDRASEEPSEETSEETATRILVLLNEQPSLSARKLAEHLGLSQRAVELQIAKLKSMGKLVRVGPKKGGYWKVLE